MYEWWRVAGGGSCGWRGHQSCPEKEACDGASLAPHCLQEALGAEGATCAKAGKARCTWTRTEVFSVGAGVGPSVATWGLYYMAPLSAPERSPVPWCPALCSARLPDHPHLLQPLLRRVLAYSVSGSGQHLSFISRLAPSVRPACLPIALSPCPWRMPERVAPSPGDLPDSGIEPGFPVLPADSLPSEPPGKPLYISPCAKIDYKCSI